MYIAGGVLLTATMYMGRGEGHGETEPGNNESWFFGSEISRSALST